MTPTSGYATKEELYHVKQELSQRIGAMELSLKQDIASVHERVEQVEDSLGGEIRRVEQNMYAMFVALFAHLGIDTPPLQ